MATESLTHPHIKDAAGNPAVVTVPASTARVLKRLEVPWVNHEPADAAAAPAGNASTDEWRAYASDEARLDVPDDASRDDIKQLVANHQAS